MKRLLQLARFALEEALGSGAEFSDVSIARGRSLDVEIQESAVVSCDRREGVAATVRCFVKGGSGIHVCNGISRGDLAHAARAAVSAARAAGPDPEFRGLPGPEPAAPLEPPGGASAPVKPLARFHLAPRQTLHLVRCGSRLLLLGATSASINHITTIEDKDEIEGIVQAIDRGQSPLSSLTRLFHRSSQASSDESRDSAISPEKLKD